MSARTASSAWRLAWMSESSATFIGYSRIEIRSMQPQPVRVSHAEASSHAPLSVRCPPPGAILARVNSQPELSRVRLDLEQAMSLVRQDRWILGSLREGRLRVLADSSPERERPFRRVRALSQLARRCLHDRRPLTVSAVSAPSADGGGEVPRP